MAIDRVEVRSRFGGSFFIGMVGCELGADINQGEIIDFSRGSIDRYEHEESKASIFTKETSIELSGGLPGFSEPATASSKYASSSEETGTATFAKSHRNLAFIFSRISVKWEYRVLKTQIDIRQYLFESLILFCKIRTEEFDKIEALV